jgi:molecular chaperone Hsp33
MEGNMDRLIKGTALNGQIRVIGVMTTELVQEGTKNHNCTPTASAALGRMLTAGVIMGSMLKSKEDKVTVKIDGGGEAEGVVVTAYEDGRVKGYIGNPNVDLPANDKGKLDVGGAIGKDGNLAVIKDMGLKEPYSGQVPIVSGEIGEDLAYYFTVSEQTPSAVALGVLVDVDWSIKAAGGFIIQMLPDADEMVADLITYRLEEMEPITTMLASGKTIDEIIEYLFDGMDFKLLQSSEPKYLCDCNREKVEKALISLGMEQLEEIYTEEKTEELKCQFCNKAYYFTHEELGGLISSLSNRE